jgi:hypothetical protein
MPFLLLFGVTKLCNKEGVKEYPTNNNLKSKSSIINDTFYLQPKLPTNKCTGKKKSQISVELNVSRKASIQLRKLQICTSRRNLLLVKDFSPWEGK